jgi:L-cysteine:1D-myo-inositol 2-amino-2-deoxy-alpha-D-glucopyranoside ligase
MKSWPSPDVPRLPGVGQVPQIYDVAGSSLRPSATGQQASMYVCGITPYDATHIGHTATYVAFDLLNRAWRDAGLEVTYVQNVTDIDDPLLERANRDGEDWAGLAERQTDLFRADMTALRVVAPAHYIGAVEAIPLVIDFVEGLSKKGAAYDVDGDVYFPVASDPHFGEVSKLSRETMLDVFAERGGDPDRQGKRDPLDCLLWLLQRPGEPAWESPLGKGRPGWHVECSAIALEHLGMSFDIQGGGSDLTFPHHEMCASEAQVLTGEKPFAHAYVYQAMVALDGEKMSKSKGNLVFSSKLRDDGVDPMAIRLQLLTHHYRQPWEWFPNDLAAAEDRLARWRTAVTKPTGPEAAKVLHGVREAIGADLDAPAAVAVVDGWVDAALAGSGDSGDTSAPALVRSVCDALLGVAL